MKILLAVDEQGAGETIVDFAAEHTRLQDADVRIFAAIPSITDYTSQVVFPDLVQELRDESRKAAIILVHMIALRLNNNCPSANVVEFVVEGHPANEILSMAEEWNADLIIVGSHGRQGIKRFLLGSVSSAIVSRAPCSVLVVKMTVAEKIVQKAEEAAGDLVTHKGSGH